MNTALIKRRLGWYGLAWLGCFVLVLLVVLAAHFLFQTDVIDLADLLIPVGLGLLALSLAGVVVMDLVSKASIGSKMVIVLLAALLLLPLLWSPVAAAAAAAWIADRSIEYSAAYAQFRITVSQLLHPLVDAVLSGAALDLVWKAFQVIAGIVGFLSSSLQVLGFVRKLSAGAPAPAPVEE
ncbi:MAG TPA: hypothetical protein VEA44_18160 [Caulobacter sp.]|nr:hypothetical protein [Caulobacter sp.]